jgi:hypothetical protein
MNGFARTWRASLVCVFGSLMCGIGCSGEHSARAGLAAPTQALVAPSPSVPVTLTGRVTETAPTSTTGIDAAVLTLSGGLNAGKQAVTNPYGYYSISDLQPGAFTIAIQADGYVGESQGVNIRTDMTSNFQLTPTPEMMTDALPGNIGNDDGTCSDSVGMKPCRIIVIPIHNPGTIDATLTWTRGNAIDLDLTLFETGIPTPLARSATPGAAPERIVTSVATGATYEFRITYSAGVGRTDFTLRVTRPN